MSCRTIVVAGKRGDSAYEGKRFSWKVQAEFDFPPKPKHSALSNGRFLGLATSRLKMLRRLTDVFLEIDRQRYRLLSSEPGGRFVALNEKPQHLRRLAAYQNIYLAADAARPCSSTGRQPSPSRGHTVSASAPTEAALQHVTVGFSRQHF